MACHCSYCESCTWRRVRCLFESCVTSNVSFAFVTFNWNEHVCRRKKLRGNSSPNWLRTYLICMHLHGQRADVWRRKIPPRLKVGPSVVCPLFCVFLCALSREIALAAKIELAKHTAVAPRKKNDLARPLHLHRLDGGSRAFARRGVFNRARRGMKSNAAVGEAYCSVATGARWSCDSFL